MNLLARVGKAIAAPADRIIREEIDDPRQWEAELNGQAQSSDPGQDGSQR